MTNQTHDPVDALWEALKQQCCVEPDKATRCVMVGQENLAAALRTQAEQSSEREAKLTAEIERLRDILDTERYKVAAGLQAIVRAVQGRKWLSEPGRGSYTYDDHRYQQEFGAALDEIDTALAPLRRIAADWSDCPRDELRVAANRARALGGSDEA